MARHTISHADELFAGAQWAGGVNQSRRGLKVEMLHRMIIEDAPAGDVDGLVEPGGAGATPGAGEVTLDGDYVDSNGIGIIPTARNISAVSSGAGDTTQTLTIKGRDIVGNPQTEDLALNGTNEVVTAKAFSEVSEVSLDIVMAGNLSLGTSVTLGNIELGLDARLLNAYDVLHALDGAGAAEGGTFTLADTTSPPTASTGDARGTYNPGNAPDGSADFVLYYIPDLTKEGYGTNFAG